MRTIYWGVISFLVGMAGWIAFNLAGDAIGGLVFSNFPPGFPSVISLAFIEFLFGLMFFFSLPVAAVAEIVRWRRKRMGRAPIGAVGVGELLMRRGITSDLVLAGTILIVWEGFWISIGWADYLGHDCYQIGGCAAGVNWLNWLVGVLLYPSVIVPVVLGSAFIVAGLRGWSCQDYKRKIVLWVVVVFAMFLPWIVSGLLAPPAPAAVSDTNTRTITTTIS